MNFEVTRIDENEFGAMAPEWNGLLRRSVCDSVFLRWEWIHTWWDLFKKNKKLFVLTVRQDDRLVGIAPFYVERKGLLGTRFLRVCSDELSPDYMDLIAAPGQESEAAWAIARDLIRQEREWDVVLWDNLRAESKLLAEPPFYGEFAQAARVSQSCPFIRIEGPYEAYVQSRRELLSYSLAKKWKRLRETENVTAVRVTEEGHLTQGLNDLFRLHGMRAGHKKMRSNFLSPEVQRFHHRVSAYFLRERILNLQLLYQGKTPISAFYAFNYKNKVGAYQTGYHPAWGKYSAGMVQWDLAVQNAFAEGFKEFDFLKGSETYKNLWSNAVRDEMNLTVYNKNLRGRFWRGMGALRSGARKVKRAMRRAPRAIS